MDQFTTFSQRNVFYLRASAYVVLQTILYLDPRHVDWLNHNPHIFQAVLAMLKTRIMPKLKREADPNGPISKMSKKERVDVYPAPEFQVAYFFRKMDQRHAVLLKFLTFPSGPSTSSVKIEDENDRVHAPIPSTSRLSLDPKEGAHSVGGRWRQEKKRQTTSESIRDSEDDPNESMNNEPNKRPRLEEGPRLDDVRIKVEETEDQDEHLFPHQGSQPPDEMDPSQDGIDLTEDDQENTAKPTLHVKYAGFRMSIAASPHLFGPKQAVERRQLSLTPAPTGSSLGARSSSRGPSQSRFTSVEPVVANSNRNARISTPLFRGMTPSDHLRSPSPSPLLDVTTATDQAASVTRKRRDLLPPVPTFGEERDGGSSEGDLGGAEFDREELDISQEAGQDVAFLMASQMLEREGLGGDGGGNDLEDDD
ncbi:hypothetical protein IE53DRAFT_359271 [Violaceomyces palustris]|uniref:Uncharacterized protein n=1 Tax=Violaceomyces palustris TaxID=1673888 RepID=A0ACD0P8J2_9BASI|nr:hypothetical protein IE53DRAFT_359271 [Violaceomyces palustris]